MFKSWIRHVAVLGCGVVLVVPLLASPANAVSTDGAFFAGIAVTSTGAAIGTVSDTINPNTAYTTVLTATGTGTCALFTGEIIIASADIGSGNPSVTHTAGSCHLYNASVLYTLTWTSLLGTSAQFQEACVWILGNQTCTLPSLNVAL